jgi:serine/threonine protein kinase
MTAPLLRACAVCTTEIQPGDRFCATCGTRVDRSCSNCGVMLVASDRFCPSCGVPRQTTGDESPDGLADGKQWDDVVRTLRAELGAEFRILRELGRGGQAAVFCAEDLALGRFVALKVLAPDSLRGARDLELFTREAQTIANLRHPHIVTLYRLRDAADLKVLVLRFLEGRSLASIIGEHGALPLAAVRAIAAQVGDALAYAHRAGVVHRDIKPANILFDGDGNAVVTDFGIAKDVNRATSSLTAGAQLGSPPYMSPEQCLQASIITGASDQYSLGIVMFEMLTGRVPFEGDYLTVTESHTHAEPPSIRALRPDCPPRWEQAIHRMLAKRPAQRWSSMDVALQAFDAPAPFTPDPETRALLSALASYPSGGYNAVADDRRLEIRVPATLRLDETATCTAVMISDSDGQAFPVSVEWQVVDARVARIDARQGTITALTAGDTEIHATTSRGTATARVAVVAPSVAEVTLDFPSPTIAVGERRLALARVYDEQGQPMATPVSWASSDLAVLEVSPDGEVRGLAPGRATLSAVALGVGARARLEVVPARQVSIALSPLPLSIAAGQSFRIAAEVFDGAGEAIEDAEVTWTALDPTVASIDGFGVVQTLAAGNARFVARCEDTEVSASVRVAEAVVMAPPPPVMPVVVEPAPGQAPERATVASGGAPDWSPDAAPTRSARPVAWGRWAGIAGAAVVVIGGAMLALRWPSPATVPPATSAKPTLSYAYVPLVEQRLGSAARARIGRSGRIAEVALVDSFDTAPVAPFELRDGLARLPDTVRARPLKLAPYRLPKGDFYSRARVQRLGGAERALFGVGFELEGPGAPAAALLELELGARPTAQVLLYRGESDRWEPLGQPVSLRRERGASTVIAATVETLLIDGALTVLVNDAVVINERALVGIPTGQLIVYPRAETALDDLSALHFGLPRR